MYSQSQRFIATILLFCILLQSCGTNNFSLDQAHRKAIAARVDNEQEKPGSPKSPSQALCKDPSHKKDLSDPLLAEKLIEPEADTPTNSLFQQPSSSGYALDRQASAQRNAKLLHATRLPSRKAQRLGQQPIQSSLSTAQPQQRDEQAAQSSQTFAAARGQTVQFKHVDGQWRATVTEQIGHFKLVKELPVVWQPGYTLSTLPSEECWQKRRIHVIDINQPPYVPQLVYVGELGLRGGGGNYYVKVAPDSDAEEPAENPRGSYGYIGAPYHTVHFNWTCFPASNGDWNARVRYSGGYTDYDEHKWVKSPYPNLRLSSNDLRECRTGVNYTWSWFHTNVNWIKVLDTPEEIKARRNARHQARQEKRAARQREEQRKALAQQAASQAAADSTMHLHEFCKKSALVQAQQARFQQAIQNLGDKPKVNQSQELAAPATLPEGTIPADVQDYMGEQEANLSEDLNIVHQRGACRYASCYEKTLTAIERNKEAIGYDVSPQDPADQEVYLSEDRNIGYQRGECSYAAHHEKTPTAIESVKEAIISGIAPQDLEEEQAVYLRSVNRHLPLTTHPFKQQSTLQEFLTTYPKDLPTEDSVFFSESLAPILRQQLAQADKNLQQELINYFERGGGLYPVVLQTCPLEEWLSRSILQDLVQEALVTENAILRDRFVKAWIALQDPLQSHSSPKLVTQGSKQLLVALQSKQQQYQLDLCCLCQLMEFLPSHAEQACALLQQADDTWFLKIKEKWLQRRLASLDQKWGKDKCQVLQQLLAHMPWNAALTTDFLAGLHQEKDYQATQRLLLFLSQHPIEEVALLEILRRGPPHHGRSLCQGWHHKVACRLLAEPLHQLFPSQADTLQDQFSKLLKRHLSTYDVIAYLLVTIQKEDPTPHQRQQQAQQLESVLSILADYQVAENIAQDAIFTLVNTPAHHWESTVHQHVVQATFQDAHELSPEEIAASIAQNAPQLTFVGDQSRLQASYNAVIDACQGTSAILQTDTPIERWQKDTVTHWARKVKGSPQKVSQSEMLAVIKQAVALQHGFTPRPTQLFSVLTLLNPANDTGRLAQINTGEGKSLIVAMIAAIHALRGQRVDVLTTSTELSIPEVQKQLPFFSMLGLTVGENSPRGKNDEHKKAVYQKDIVYGTAEDFQGDILRTKFFRKDIRGNRGFGVVIVDEVDSMLFDHRSHSIRLSSQMPAMNHLEIVLGAIWYQVNQVASCLRSIEGKDYFVIPANKELELPESKVPVADKVAFLKENTQNYLNGLLRVLSCEEREKLDDFNERNIRIEELNDAIAKEKNKKRRSELEEELKVARQALQESPWVALKKDYLEIPRHLQAFARSQIPYWIDSAIYALFYYKKNQHYDVKELNIVPIDYKNTGVLQRNTVWDNGLAQFLQIKEGLQLKPEQISTNFISKVGYFKAYRGRLYGLTGTLGNQRTRAFLSAMYGTDMVFVPPYKERELTGNDHSIYHCKELPARILSTPAAWYESIRASALRQGRNGQPVLIICKYINQVEHLQEHLKNHYDPAKIFTYTGQKRFTKRKVGAGEIVIATNIAGRGTDLSTDEQAESHGGLHVCITFLPENCRVELQNAGRTARQGKRGTAQLIVLHQSDETTGDETSIETLRAQRDQQEAARLEKAQSEAHHMLSQDRLFTRYCGLEKQLLPTAKALEELNLLQELQSHWAAYAEAALAPATVSRAYTGYIQHTARAQLTHMTGQEELSPELLAETQAALRQEFPQAAFQKAHKEDLLNKFLQQLQDSISIPADVLLAFLDQKPIELPNINYASKFDWSEHERDGLQESWGFWHKQHNNAHHERAFLEQAFDSFERERKAAAAEDALIQNPYHFVHKGHDKLARGYVSSAVKAYERAIDLDTLYSVNARYYKARALLTPAKNKHNQKEAKEALQKARYLILSQYKPALINFDTLVGQTGKKARISEHVQHQLDILLQQEDAIQAALAVLETAQNKDWEVKITETRSLRAAFKDAQGDRSQAIAEAESNGLQGFFTIQEQKPPPWLSIVSLAFIGIAQITAGVLIASCTFGLGLSVANGLINEGVSDLITSVTSAIRGDFSWGDWGLQKAISMSVSLISAGWDAIKKGCKAVKEATQNLGRLAVDKGKDSLKAALNRVGLQLGKGVAKECVTSLVNYGLEKTIVQAIEKEVAERVTNKITAALEKSELVKRALALDVKNQNNAWQTLLVQEGLALLAPEENNKLLAALEAIAKGVASNKLPGIQAIFQTQAMTAALAEILEMTDNFLVSFADQLAIKYTEQLPKAEEEATDQEAQKQEAAPTALQGIAISPPVDDQDIQVHEVAMDEAYQSDLRDYYYEAPSSPGKLCSVFSSNITSQISSKIQSTFLRPASGGLVSMGIDKLLEGVERSLEEQEEAAAIDGAAYVHADKLAHEKQEHDKESGQELLNETAVTYETIQAQAVSTEAAALAQEVLAGQEAGIAEVGASAGVIDHPIAIYEKGRLIDIQGRHLPGKLIHVQRTPSSDGTSGHYEPYDPINKKALPLPRSAQGAVNPGKNNCFYDAVACQLDSDLSGSALRARVAHRLSQSSVAKDLYAAVKNLEVHNPKALRRGGRVLEYADPRYHWAYLTGDTARQKALKQLWTEREDNAKLYSSILVDQTAEQFGIKDIFALGAIGAGQPLLPTRGKFKGATKGTSVASKYLSKIPGKSPIRLPMLTDSGLMFTTSVGRFVGRTTPYVGWGILAHDASTIIHNTQKEYNRVVQNQE